MKKSLVSIIFWKLILVFLVMAITMVVPTLRNFLGDLSTLILPILWIAFFLMGIALMIVTIREKVEGKLKKFLILTGASAAGFLTGIFLHNAFYALAVFAKDLAMVNYLMQGLSVAFFIIALIVSPIAFAVGIMGSTVYFRKQKSKEKTGI